MLLSLDFSSKLPIYMQIRNQIVLGIASGELAPGEKLPTIRALAEQSGVNMMTVSKAYAALRQEGYITPGRHRRGRLPGGWGAQRPLPRCAAHHSRRGPPGRHERGRVRRALPRLIQGRCGKWVKPR